MESIKDLLERIRFADLEIKSLMTLKDRLGARALAITSNISERVSGSKDIDGVYSIVDGYVDLEKVIIDKSKGLLEAKKKAFALINDLDDNMHRIVLIERYFNSEPWKSIAIHISRSEKRTRQIHDKAIKLCEIRRETDVRL